MTSIIAYMQIEKILKLVITFQLWASCVVTNFIIQHTSNIFSSIHRFFVTLNFRWLFWNNNLAKLQIHFAKNKFQNTNKIYTSNINLNPYWISYLCYKTKMWQLSISNKLKITRLRTKYRCKSAWINAERSNLEQIWW